MFGDLSPAVKCGHELPAPLLGKIHAPKQVLKSRVRGQKAAGETGAKLAKRRGRGRDLDRPFLAIPTPDPFLLNLHRQGRSGTCLLKRNDKVRVTKAESAQVCLGRGG